MILPQAKKEYLTREMESFEWMKSMSEEKLDRELAELGANTEGLWRHQKIGLLLGAYRPRFAYWYSMGLGKTLMAIRICEVHDCQNVLVVVPYRFQVESWAREIAKWKPSCQIDVMTYAAARNKVSNKVRGQDGNKLKVDPQKAKDFGGRYQATVVDESSLIGNRRSLIFKAIRKVSGRHKVRLALSGTPFGRDPSLLWSQMAFVDGMETLGAWGMFKSVFLREKDQWGGLELVRKRLPDLQRLMAHRSLRMKVEDCMSMPDKTYQRVEYEMPETARKAYNEMKARMLAVLRSGVKEEIRSCFVRLRQLTSGFLYVEEEGERETLDFGHKTRVEIAAELVEQTEDPVLVFADFRATHAKTLQIFKKRGISVTTDSSAWSDGRGQVLLLSASAGALGGNYQRASYCIFLETPISPQNRTQAEARIWRANQDRTCQYFDLVAQGGIDGQILGALKEGKDLMKTILETREMTATI